MPTIHQIILKSDNKYKKSFLKNIVKQDIKKTNNFSSINGCSIIIPFFDNDFYLLEKNLVSIQNQNISLLFPIEIIVVDDGSHIKLNKKKFEKITKKYQIIFLRLNKNQGRASARNLGLLYAKHDLAIFIDSDVILPNNFIFNHLLFHNTFKNSAMVGFSYNINLKAKILKIKNAPKNISPPTFRKDFRYKKFVPFCWKNIYKNIPFKNFGKNYYILRDSNYFYKMGKGKIIGVWDLPFMFVTRNASVMRKDLIKVGGFDMRFNGWGMEDVHLGAKLIAKGLYIIPNRKANCYHVIKKRYSDKNRIKEFSKNLKLYNQIKNEKFRVYLEKQWKETIEKVFRNKFSVQIFYPCT